MSTRRLLVILFVSRFKCTIYPVVYCLVCLWWPRRFIIKFRLTACQYFKDFFKVFYLLYSSRHLHRLSNNLAARDYVRVVMLTDFVITLAICIICQFAAPPPLVTSPTNSKSWRPWMPTWCNCGESGMFQALAVPDRYPAGLSASLHRLDFMLWLCWLGSQAKRSLIVLFLLGSLPSAGYQSGLHYSRDVRECNLV